MSEKEELKMLIKTQIASWMQKEIKLNEDKKR
jgi:hypothetical protein